MKKPKRYYAALIVSRKFEIESCTTDLCEEKAGIVAVLPVFTNKRKARKYVGATGTLLTIEERPT